MDVYLNEGENPEVVAALRRGEVVDFTGRITVAGADSQYPEYSLEIAVVGLSEQMRHDERVEGSSQTRTGAVSVESRPSTTALEGYPEMDFSGVERISWLEIKQAEVRLRDDGRLPRKRKSTLNPRMTNVLDDHLKDHQRKACDCGLEAAHPTAESNYTAYGYYTAAGIVSFVCYFDDGPKKPLNFPDLGNDATLVLREVVEQIYADAMRLRDEAQVSATQTTPETLEVLPRDELITKSDLSRVWYGNGGWLLANIERKVRQGKLPFRLAHDEHGEIALVRSSAVEVLHIVEALHYEGPIIGRNTHEALRMLIPEE